MSLDNEVIKSSNNLTFKIMSKNKEFLRQCHGMMDMHLKKGKNSVKTLMIIINL